MKSDLPGCRGGGSAPRTIFRREELEFARYPAREEGMSRLLTASLLFLLGGELANAQEPQKIQAISESAAPSASSPAAETTGPSLLADRSRLFGVIVRQRHSNRQKEHNGSFSGQPGERLFFFRVPALGGASRGGDLAAKAEKNGEAQPGENSRSPGITQPSDSQVNSGGVSGRASGTSAGAPDPFKNLLRLVPSAKAASASVTSRPDYFLVDGNSANFFLTNFDVKWETEKFAIKEGMVGRNLGEGEEWAWVELHNGAVGLMRKKDLAGATEEEVKQFLALETANHEKPAPAGSPARYEGLSIPMEKERPNLLLRRMSPAGPQTPAPTVEAVAPNAPPEHGPGVSVETPKAN